MLAMQLYCKLHLSLFPLVSLDINMFLFFVIGNANFIKITHTTGMRIFPYNSFSIT